MYDVFVILAQAINVFGRVLEFLILARVLLSWIPLRRDNAVVRLIYALTEPILGPIRSLLAKSPLGGAGMPLDFSPIIAFLLIQLAQTLLLQLLAMLVNGLM